MARPRIPKIPSIKKRAGMDRRKTGRISLQELNARGIDALRERPEFKEPPDQRGTLTRIFDIIDLPRNIVANIVADLGGIRPDVQREKGALGIRKVFASDVLKRLGVKNNIVRGVVGFLGDVALDPLTYASLGATTGVKIAKGLKITKRGMKQIRRVATGAGRAGDVTSVAKAAGIRNLDKAPEILKRLAKFRGRDPARLAGKRGGLLTQRITRVLREPRSAKELAGASEFFKKFGLKGRNIVRAPFAARGLALKRGRTARTFKELTTSSGLDAILKQSKAERAAVAVGRGAAIQGQRIQRLQQGRRTLDQAIQAEQVVKKRAADSIAELGGKFQVTPEAEKNLRDVVAASAGKIKEARKESKLLAEKIKTLAKVRLAETKKAERMGAKALSAAESLRAPTVIRQRQIERTGKAFIPPTRLPVDATRPERVVNFFRGMKEGLFGQGASAAKQRFVSAVQGQSAKATIQGAIGTDRARKALAPAIQSIQQAMNVSPERASTILFSIVENSGKSVYEGTDAGLQLMKQAQAAGVLGNATVKGTIDDILNIAKKAFDEQSARKIAPGGRIEGFLPRRSSEEVKKLSRFEETVLGKTGFQPERVTKQVWQLPDGTKETLLAGGNTNARRLKELGNLGAKKVSDFNITTEEFNRLFREGAPEATNLFGPDLQRVKKGEQFGTDVAEAMGTIEREKTARLALADLRDLAQETGFKISRTELQQGNQQLFRNLARVEVDPKSPFANTIGREISQLALPQPVADLFTDFFRVTQQPEKLRGLLRGIDTVLGQWKGFQLLHPAYTARNVGQNLVGHMMNGGNMRSTLRWNVSGRLKAIRKAVAEGTDIAKLPFKSVKIGPVTYPVSAIVTEGKLNNMFQSAHTSMIRAGVFARVDPRKPFFRFNTNLETHMRLAAWFSFIEDGMSPSRAALKTLMSMPDLTDISRLEKATFARVWPWYRWMRRNGALQLFHFLPRTPAFAAGSEKLRRAIQQSLSGDDSVPEELRPEWMQDQQAAQVTGGEEEGQVFLLASWLPFQELQRLAAGVIDPRSAAQLAVEQARPELKFIMETGVGADIFRKQPVKKFSLSDMVTKLPKAIVGQSGTPMDNLFALRPLKEIFDRIPAAAKRGVIPGVVRGVLGGVAQTVSKERGLKDAAIRLRGQAIDLRRLINRAREANDPDREKALIQQLFQVFAQMQRLGVPGVAKATQAVLEKEGIPGG